MSFRPVVSNPVLSRHRAAQAEKFSRLLDRPHKESAHIIRQFGESIELCLVMDVQNLLYARVCPACLLVEDVCSLLDQHGPGRLQKRVQRRVRGTNMQTASVEADEIRTLFQRGRNVVGETAQGGEIAQETRSQGRAALALRRPGSRGGYDGTQLPVPGPVKKGIMYVQQGALLPARNIAAYCHQ